MGIERAVEHVKRSRYLIVFTGAGVSAESGIPTFRGPDGLWRRYRVEDLATPEAFLRNPKLVWEWYAWRLKLVRNAEPNEAHRAIALLEKLGLVKAVITQNVDGLHQRAGSKRVIELHGNISRVKCIKCGYKGELDELPKEIPPRCPICGGLLRPDVVWFGEPLPSDKLAEAYREAREADAVLVVGTSGVVEPAGSIPLIVLEGGGVLINVNPEPNRYDPVATVNVRMTAVQFFRDLIRALKATGP
ncbi:MAG: NAD-dependent deacylase [Desulfurococcales archaeon]|nr:NAD-dependent deacylase [Desulfurococcales archaeon]